VWTRAALTLTVDPCQVASITGALTQTTLSYALRTPALTGAAYSFT